jgi:hypothetical protein
MNYSTIVKTVADVLKEYDTTRPVHKSFQPGIGPFGEPQIVKVVAQQLTVLGLPAVTKRLPDLAIPGQWAMEFKIVRPFGDNGREAENWSVNLLHPYPGNVSLLSDALKLQGLGGYRHKGLFVMGYEHAPAKISLDPLLDSFELIARQVMGIGLHERIEERRPGLCHPEHQVLRCIGWQVV